MGNRFMSLWFCRLKTDWMTIRKPERATKPFVLTLPEHNRVMVSAANGLAVSMGVHAGMRLADAKAILPAVEVFSDSIGREEKLLKAIGEWSIRYTPFVAVDLPDGLILNITGCAHLWGGETGLMDEITERFKSKGYLVRAAIACTVGAAWATARYSETYTIVPEREQRAALLPLPPAALRLEDTVLEKLKKLGFQTIGALLTIPRTELKRRFGQGLILRIMQALGEVDKHINLIKEPHPYEERLPCLEPISTRTGIEIALQKLLEKLSNRLAAEGKGIRLAGLKTYRIDGKTQQINIGTSKATCQTGHLFKLFELHIGEIRPGLGIELFVLEAAKVEDTTTIQQAIWKGKTQMEDNGIAELLDRVAGRVGPAAIRRYLPQERYWPERALKNTTDIKDKPHTLWRTDLKRPVSLLPVPQPIGVSAPIPDYPPMLFTYQGQIHHIKRADGPERIEREWWLKEDEYRDYYIVEDQQGYRYWVYRSGHYDKQNPEWYLHGFFA